MIKLNEEEEAQKKLEFCTRAEKYGPQLRAKFKCWNSNFPICGATDPFAAYPTVADWFAKRK